MEKNAYNWIKSKKWLMPLGFAALMILCVLAILLCVGKDFSEMATDNVFDIGVDILSILICLAIYYGCMNGRDRESEATYLLTAMLRVIGGAQFLDVCVHLMDGIPFLWFLYRIVMAGYYAANPMMNLLFWHYVRVSLRMSGERTEKITRLMEAVFAVEMVACWINLAVPFYFTVNRQGQYSRALFNPLNAGFVVVTTIILIYALLRSNALNRKNRILLVFIVLPLISTLTDAMHVYLISEYSACLLAVVLLYGVLYADRSNHLAATETELGTAARIQANMLPNSFPLFPKRGEFALNATMEPAKEVGGDFYDFFLVDDDHLAMAVADVSGKGVPAALFMMTARTMLKDAALEGLDPASVLFQVNERLGENNEDLMFVTAWLGILEISTGTLTYADAGHEKLLVYQKGTWRFLKKGLAPALAFAEPGELEEMPEQYQYRNETLRLRPGDAIFQYTDGVTEATYAPNAGMNAPETMFGEKGLLSAVSELPGATPEELLPHVRWRIDTFVRGAEQFDDITMLALRYLGADGATGSEGGR